MHGLRGLKESGTGCHDAVKLLLGMLKRLLCLEGGHPQLAGCRHHLLVPAFLVLRPLVVVVEVVRIPVAVVVWMVAPAWLGMLVVAVRSVLSFCRTRRLGLVVCALLAGLGWLVRLGLDALLSVLGARRCGRDIVLLFRVV